MRGFLTAMAFLTALPVGPHQGDFAASRAYFPLVGLLLGGLTAGLDVLLRLALPLPLTSALLLAALVVATRALHVEGFLDTCDGLLGGQTRRRKLEIMRDSRVGAFAVVGGVCLMLVKWTALAAVGPPLRLPSLLLFPCLSRWGMAVAMGLFPYARDQGLGAAFRPGHGGRRLAVAGGLALAPSLILAGGAGLVLLAVATGLAWLLGWWMSRMLGGLTGDTYGAVNEILEVTVLVFAAALSGAGPLLFPGLLTG